VRTALAIAITAWALSAHASDSARVNRFVGTCDASAAVLLDAQTFVVANDEDNLLRLYRTSSPEAIARIDLNPFLRPTPDAKDAEADLEAAARLGDHILWIGSHGRNKQGKLRPARSVLFATKVTQKGSGWSLEPEGSIYRNLTVDFSTHAQLTAMKLWEEIRLDIPREDDLDPKQEGLNIEGLGATADGQGVWIGLRNPMRKGKSILVELSNAKAVVLEAAVPVFGSVEMLDLAGDAIRSVAYDATRSRHLIVAGPPHAKSITLWAWAGPGSTPVRLSRAIEHNAEGLAISIDHTEALIISDVGSTKLEGRECKSLANAFEKSFPTQRVPLE
jgi:hypothetical protein